MSRIAKSITVVLMYTVVFFCFTQSVYAGEWKREGRFLKYQNDDQSEKANEWLYLDEEWYYFDEDGYLVRGWIYDNGKYYYTHTNQYINDYSFNHEKDANGRIGRLIGITVHVKMAKDEVLIINERECRFDSSGAWIEDYDSQNGYFKVDEKEYYRKNGEIAKGWFTDGMMVWYADETGVVDRSVDFAAKIHKTYMTMDREIKQAKVGKREKDSIMMMMQMIPNNVINRYFIRDNSYIHISYEPPVLPFSAVYHADANVIELYDCNTVCLPHEFGHYVDYAAGKVSDTAEFRQLADKYVSVFSSGRSNHISTNQYVEFFAEVFDAIYFNYDDWERPDIKANMPELYDYITAVTNSL